MDEFMFNIFHVEKYLVGHGYDMGCGSSPLPKRCIHVDISPQPLAEIKIGGPIILADAVSIKGPKLNYIFSSHMVEDLFDEEDVVNCLNGWAERLLEVGGYIILLLPDMEGGRYPKVEEGGNPSHNINIGVSFINQIKDKLTDLELVQMDTIPYDKSCTLDVVFHKFRAGNLQS